MVPKRKYTKKGPKKRIKIERVPPEVIEFAAKPVEAPSPVPVPVHELVQVFATDQVDAVILRDTARPSTWERFKAWFNV